MVECRASSLGGLLCLILLGLTSALALGDGMAFYVDGTGHQPLQGREQLAAIDFHEGREKMLLAVRLDRDPARRGLWLVPRTLVTTKLDVVAGFPRFGGVDPRGQAADRIFNLLALTSSDPRFLATLRFPENPPGP